ncbi:hypothetical protein CMI48_00100 [Candidatus Pacearchaeota archaeon]|nr:hypothetical protein [Candidatus Pacearchaeota archaeon]
MHHHPHQHIRKRKGEEFPSQKGIKKFLDKIIFAVAFIMPLMTLPQIYNIWILKDASGVSVVTWASFLFFALIWLSYGIVHREKPLIISYATWIVMHISVVVGAVLYG